MTSEYERVLNKIAATSRCPMTVGVSIRFVAAVIIACLMAASSAAQTAKAVRGAAAVEPRQNEPPWTATSPGRTPGLNADAERGGINCF